MSYPATFHQDFNEAIAWAKNVMANKSQYVILDTETTGLDKTAQPIEITITDLSKNPLLNTRIKPTVPIHPKATEVHGISVEDLENEPLYSEYHRMVQNVTRGKKVLIFNEQYDTRIIQQVCTAFDLHYSMADAVTECVMIPFSIYQGEWNSNYHNYKWAKLPGGDHTALGDCHAVVDHVLIPMSESEPFDL